MVKQMAWLWGFGFASFCEPGNSVVMGISHLLFYAPECLCDVSGIELRRWLSRVAGRTPAIPDKLLYCRAVLAGSLNLDTFPVRECLLPALNDSPQVCFASKRSLAMDVANRWARVHRRYTSFSYIRHVWARRFVTNSGGFSRLQQCEAPRDAAE